MDEAAAYYLDRFLEPISDVLAEPDITDIFINRPQEIWVERQGGAIERRDIQSLTEDSIGRLARQIAAASAQGTNRSSPLLAANLPDGSRIQIAGPPATRNGHVLAIRRHLVSDMSLSDWGKDGSFAYAVADTSQGLEGEAEFCSVPSDEAEEFLRKAVVERKNIVIAGGTSSGKTTFLDGLIAEIPSHERLVVIEDTEELRLIHQNSVGLIAHRSAEAETNTSGEDLLIAALRMRPDRILLGELRGHEAFTFLRAINTGHPGSMTTLHADSPRRAIDQIALLVLQSGARLNWDAVRHYVENSVDVFVQMQRLAGERKITQILAKDLK